MMPKPVPGLSLPPMAPQPPQMAPAPVDLPLPSLAISVPAANAGSTLQARGQSPMAPMINMAGSPALPPVAQAPQPSSLQPLAPQPLPPQPPLLQPLATQPLPPQPLAPQPLASQPLSQSMQFASPPLNNPQQLTLPVAASGSQPLPVDSTLNVMSPSSPGSIDDDLQHANQTAAEEESEMRSIQQQISADSSGVRFWVENPPAAAPAVPAAGVAMPQPSFAAPMQMPQMQMPAQQMPPQ